MFLFRSITSEIILFLFQEQGPIQGNKLVQVTSQLVKTKSKQDYPYKVPNMVECEFFLLEMLVCIIVW